MLSRENVIHRSAGEARDPHASRVTAGARNDAVLRRRIWGKIVMLILIVGLLGMFVVLNRHAVIEPRLHLVFSSFDRPSLLVVMLLTSLVSAAGALLVRAALGTMRQLRDVQARQSPERGNRQAVPVNAPALAAAPSL